MNKEEIIVIYGQDYKNMTKELLGKAQAADLIPARETLIGIKPNLLGPIHSSEGATTHPEIVAGIIEYLRENGFTNLVMLESSWVGDSTKDSLLVTGFDRLAEQYGVPFWDLQEDAGVSRRCADMDLHICERAAEIEFLINVPVLKGHCQTRMTCALKNMKGLLPAAEKRRFHRMGLHEPIGRLSAGLSQDLIVVDSISPDLTFEDGGHPVPLHRIMAARDPVLCDAYGAELLGLSAEEVGYICAAAACGAGSMDVSRAKITVLGDQELARRAAAISGRETAEANWRRILAIEENVHAVDTCSACYASLLPVLVKLDEEGLLERLPGKICMGQACKGKRGELGIGSCTRLFDRHLPGCPPSQEHVEAWLRELLG